MERDELITLWDGVLDAFSPSPADAKGYGLRISSGTSERGPLIALGKLDPKFLREWLGGAERTLVCYGPRGPRLFSIIGINMFGGQSLALDGGDLVEARVALLQDFLPTRVLGFPAFVLRAAALMPESARRAVVSLHLAGELLNESMEQTLRASFPRATLAVQYVASEVGAITEPTCGYLPRNHFHPHTDVRVEIDQEDTDGVGELLISKLFSGVFIERYRIGDVGRLYPCSCPCGATQALEILGRSGRDYIKLAGGILRVEEFDRVLGDYKEFIDDYRVEASTPVAEGVPRGKVELSLHCVGPMPTEAMQKEMTSRISSHLFVTPTRTLAQLVEQGLFEPLEISFVSRPFLQGHKAVKLRYRV